ncbi:GNAT family N-acetyltransferase [Nocardia sp. NPDC051052]|uniref:GNAT family N-acetyltransferase n=1 Tax=Nocardia sp. NPDC051052 TaxID=3364322 RepID=UPI0037ABC900
MTAHRTASGVDADALTITECGLAESPAEWDDLAPATGIGFYSSRSWNLAMRGQNGARESVVIARDSGGRLRAVLPIFRYDSGPGNSHLHPGTLFGGASHVSDPVARRWEPVTVVGSASGYGTTPVVSGDLTAWSAAVNRAGAAPAGTVLIPHLTGADVTRLRTVLPDRPALLTSVRVSVPVPTVPEADYEDTLRKRDRDRVRWERGLLKRGGRVIAVEPITEANVEEIAELQEKTQRRHDTYGDTRQFVERYRQIRSVFGDRLFAFVCRHEGRAIGSLSCIEHGTTLIGRSAGLDYDRVGRYAEYFNLMIHEPLRYCLRRGLREIDLGVAGYRQKLLRGGQPVPVWSILLHPPSSWTQEDTVEHNRGTAQSLRADLGPMCPPELAECFERIQRTGTAM